MVDFILAITFILLLLSGWIFTQYLARWYAARHPEFGPAREEGSGCGKSCLCSGGSCKKQSHSNNFNDSSNNTRKHQEEPSS